jgi:aspartate kinase
MALIVQNYGSSVLSGKKGIKSAAKSIIKTHKQNNSVVAVMSAQGFDTDDLKKKAAGISKNPAKRELDALLVTAEQACAALTAAAVETGGVPAISLAGYQSGIETDSCYGNARIKKIDTERIFRELDRKNVVIIAGAQGWNRFDESTSLGAGGSELTAVALAAALKADSCEIYMKNGGVYTADKECVINSRKLNEISYDEMLEMASLGNMVISSRAVELAKKYNVNLKISKGITDESGTIVKEACNVEKMLVRGVTKDSDIARISVMGVQDRPGMAFKLFSMLARENIKVDLIIQSIGTDKTNDISFTISKDKLKDVLELINGRLELFGAKEVKYSDKYAKVSIVGAGMVNNPDVASMMFEALYNMDINIHMIATSEIKISVLIDENNADRAVNAIHERFGLGNPLSS